MQVASQSQTACEAEPEDPLSQQAATAAPPEDRAPSRSSTPAMTAVIDVPDFACQLQQLGGPVPQTPTLEPQQQRGTFIDAAGRTLAHEDLRPNSSWHGRAQDLPEDLLDHRPLAGVIEEAARAGRQLPAVRRRQLAAALQSAAFAAAQLQQALQSASNILGFDLEDGTHGSPAMPPLEPQAQKVLLQHRAQQPHSSVSALRTGIAAQQGAPLQAADREAAMHQQPTMSRKRSRSESTIHAAAEAISTGLAKKKQKRLQPQQPAPESIAQPSKRALRKQRQAKQQLPDGQHTHVPSGGVAASELPAALNTLPAMWMALSAPNHPKEVHAVCELEASAKPVAADGAAPQALPAADGADMEVSGSLASAAAAQQAVDPQPDEQASEVDIPDAFVRSTASAWLHLTVMQKVRSTDVMC